MVCSAYAYSASIDAAARGMQVKLMPSLVEAWNVLGHCYWKKGDLQTARHCFVGALKKVRASQLASQRVLATRRVLRGSVVSVVCGTVSANDIT